ncbi:dephospho-CoA kinase [Neobacillus sp. PS3-40]|jgi:dephospho-CoA kinase|uniref:dephospho-CoA kinase n=1 Tax=Neobacillus sp. PS3-40 TaxID=3070679 RepID=UPI0027E1F231|nr:dephospho-CoA kinase [Neobacillus sp. PS3-40]WML45623.1 dephospho-CoA kinase [Neobacillus sp. PS3-40]
MTLIVGLTGGIASGKSTVSNMLKEMKITVIDADVEARLAVKKGEPAYLQIVKEFGQSILMPDGEIDRPKLGSIIFYNDQKRQLLNQIVHPEVRRRMTRQKEAAIAREEKIIILDIPLLFESKLMFMVDKVVLVYVDQNIQIQRLMERNNLTYEDAMARVKSQMPLSEKVGLANEVINNNGTLQETENQLEELLLDWGLKKD